MNKYRNVIISCIIVVTLAMMFVGLRSSTKGDGITVDFGQQASLLSSQYSIIDGESKRYFDPEKRFSFSYPSEFTVGNFGDEEIGETVLLQRKGEKVGFQIFVTLFDEPGNVLTVNRLLEEIPDLSIIDPRPVDFDGEILGISFISDSESFGKSREIWIAQNGFLYQMSTYANEQSLLGEVLSSWRF